MPRKKTNLGLYIETFWEELFTSGQAPVGAFPGLGETSRDNGRDTVFWLTSRPDTYQMESGTKDTVVLSPTSFELGLGTPDVNIDFIQNFNVHEGDVVTAGDRSLLADLPNRAAVVSTADFFDLFTNIGIASNIVVNTIFDGDVPEDYAQLFNLAQTLVGEAFGGIFAKDLMDDGQLNSLVLFSYTDHVNKRVGEDGKIEFFADTDAQVTVLQGVADDQSEIEAMLGENGFEVVLNKDATIEELVEFQASAFIEADFLDPGFFPSGALEGLG